MLRYKNDLVAEGNSAQEMNRRFTGMFFLINDQVIIMHSGLTSRRTTQIGDLYALRQRTGRAVPDDYPPFQSLLCCWRDMVHVSTVRGDTWCVTFTVVANDGALSCVWRKGGPFRASKWGLDVVLECVCLRRGNHNRWFGKEWLGVSNFLDALQPINLIVMATA